MDWMPIGEWIFVEKPEDTSTDEHEQVGQLFVPKAALQDSTCDVVKVLAVGDGYVTQQGKLPLKVKVNDMVMIRKNTGHEIHIEGHKFLRLRETDLIGIKDGTT